MKLKSIYISIPKPCHESWASMDATERGAFCHSCRKEVIDFSAMTDREVVEYLAKYKTTCGKFRNDQLNTKLSIPQLDNGNYTLFLRRDQVCGTVSLKISAVGYLSQVVLGITISPRPIVNAKLQPGFSNASIGLLIYKPMTKAQKIKYTFRHLFRKKSRDQIKY